MDANRFDRLTCKFSAAGTRRAGLRLLAGLSLGGVLGFLVNEEETDAKRHRHRGRRQKKKTQHEIQRVDDEKQPHKPHCRRVKGKGHGHHGRRKHCEAHHGGDGSKNNGKDKPKPCQPESLAQTCDGTCGTIQNNCQKDVDCGSCACDPACAMCHICQPDTVQCEPDPAQVGDPCGDGLVCQADGTCACQGDSCGGCRACEGGQCVVDTSVVCTPLDQCHDAGVCDPETGECSNPRKDDGASCDDGDRCTANDTCQNGVCTAGAPKDCSGEGDVCNDGACRSSDGACIKQPKQNGTECNADNTSCTAGDSCQNGVCTAGAGVDCRTRDDQCNRGVCRQSDGQCVQEPRQDGTICSDGNACTQPDSCQSGACVAGPATVCAATDECHLPGACNVATGFCSDPKAPEGTSCGFNGQCANGECVEICLTTNQICDPDNDTCCNEEGEICQGNAACSQSGEGRCCRPEEAFCTVDCDCCDGVCAGGVCCAPTRQCNFTSDCCEGYTCNTTTNVCDAVCGTGHAFCGDGPSDFPCCDGFRCFDGECWPNNCLALTETCSDAGQCCQDGGTICAVSRDTFPDMGCCKAHNQTCQETEECCHVDICAPHGRCCRPGYNDPERPFVRGCGAEGGCCPGWKCNPFSDACCAKEGQPVPPGGFLDCCNFTAEGGFCTCATDGQQCAAPGGNPFLSSCCDGLICISGQCQPPCGIWISPGCSAQFPCCRGQHCNEFAVCADN